MDMLKKILISAGGSTTIEYVGSSVVSYVGQETNKTISLTSLTGGLSTQPAAGDIVICCNTAVGDDKNANPTTITPTGYTSLYTIHQNEGNKNSVTHFVSYKIMGATPDTSYTLTNGTGDISCAGGSAVQVWRGLNTTTPAETPLTIAVSNDTALVNPASITPTNANTSVIVFGTIVHEAGTFTAGSSDLTDFKSSGADDTVDSTIGTGYSDYSGTAIDPAVWTFGTADNTNYGYVASCIALIPA